MYELVRFKFNLGERRIFELNNKLRVSRFYTYDLLYF
jgi:hypothetical protein